MAYNFLQSLQPFKNLVAPFMPSASTQPKPKPAPSLTSNFSTAPVTPALNYTPYRAPTPAPNMSTINGPAYAPPPVMSSVKPAPASVAPPSAPVKPYVAPPVSAPSAPPPMTSQGQQINPATGGIVGQGAGAGAGAGATPAAPPAPPPIAPVIPQSYYDDVSRAEGDVKANTPITPDELAAQAELDTLQESFRTGYQNTAQQAIPMEFIVGQQKAIEQRKIGLAEPLNARMSRLQAKRLSALDASKFALERADKRLELETGRNKPVSLGVGENLVNPMTGKTVASGGSMTDKQALDTFYNLTQTYPDANVSWNPALSPQQNLQAAQKAASQSPSFQAKNTVYAINPLTGQPQIISKMGGGAFGAGGGAPSGGGVNADTLAPELKAALTNVGGNVQFFDKSKITAAQLPYLQRASQEMGVPLLEKADADKIQTSYATYSAAKTTLDLVKTLAGKVLNAANNPGDMTAQAARLKAIELAPYLSRDDDAKQFIVQRNAVLTALSKATGQVGVLTDQDLKIIGDAMPSYGDNKELAMKKAANLDSVIRSVLEGATRAYMGTSGGGAGAPSGGGGASDPLGIF